VKTVTIFKKSGHIQNNEHMYKDSEPI